MGSYYSLCSFMTKFCSAVRRDLQLDFIALIVFIMISITAEFKKFSLAPAGSQKLPVGISNRCKYPVFCFRSLSNQAITACEIEN